MKKIIKHIIMIILGITLSHLAMSYYEASLNIFTWTDTSRGISITFMIVYTIIYSIVQAEINNNKIVR